MRVEEHGPEDQVWDDVPATEAPAAAIAINEQGEEITDFVFHAQNWAEDITLIRDMGFKIDNDNEPALENVSLLLNAPAHINRGVLFKGQEWGWDGIDHRAIV